MSEAAIIWAEAIADGGRAHGLDVLDCAILAKLASVADDDDGAWMRVEDIASRVNSSVRNVQYRLRKLCGVEEWIKDKPAIPSALIEDSGRTYRYGTRSIPIYLLKVDHMLVADILARRRARREERAMVQSRMGANSCTHAPKADRDPCTRMGATVCTPKEPSREQALADANAAGAREVEGEGFEGPDPGSPPSEAFERAFAAWSPHAVQSTEWEPSWAGWCDQVPLAGSEARLEACVTAFLGHPSIKTRAKPLKGFQYWLRAGGWRAVLHGLDAAAEAGRPVGGFDGPPEVRAVVSDHYGQRAAPSIIDNARWREEGRVLTPHTGWAFEQMKRLDWAAVGVTLIDPRGRG